MGSRVAAGYRLAQVLVSTVRGRSISPGSQGRLDVLEEGVRGTDVCSQSRCWRQRLQTEAGSATGESALVGLLNCKRNKKENQEGFSPSPITI